MKIAPACSTAREASFHGREDGGLIVADRQSYVRSKKNCSRTAKSTQLMASS